MPTDLSVLRRSPSGLGAPPTAPNSDDELMASSSNSNSSAMMDDDVGAVVVVDDEDAVVVAVDGVDADVVAGDAARSPNPQRLNGKHNLLGGWEAKKGAKYRIETTDVAKLNAKSKQLYLSEICSCDFSLDTNRERKQDNRPNILASLNGLIEAILK